MRWLIVLSVMLLLVSCSVVTYDKTAPVISSQHNLASGTSSLTVTRLPRPIPLQYRPISNVKYEAVIDLADIIKFDDASSKLTRLISRGHVKTKSIKGDTLRRVIYLDELVAVLMTTSGLVGHVIRETFLGHFRIGQHDARGEGIHGEQQRERFLCRYVRITGRDTVQIIAETAQSQDLALDVSRLLMLPHPGCCETLACAPLGAAAGRARYNGRRRSSRFIRRRAAQCSTARRVQLILTAFFLVAISVARQYRL